MNSPLEIDVYDLFCYINSGKRYFLKYLYSDFGVKYIICENGKIKAEFQELISGDFERFIVYDKGDDCIVMDFGLFIRECQGLFPEEITWMLFHLKNISSGVDS